MNNKFFSLLIIFLLTPFYNLSSSQKSLLTIVDIDTKNSSSISHITFKKRTSASAVDERFMIEDKNGFVTIATLCLIAKAFAEKEFFSLKNKSNASLNQFTYNFLEKKLPAGFKGLVESVSAKILKTSAFLFNRHELINFLNKSTDTWKNFFNNLGKFLEKEKFTKSFDGKIQCKYSYNSLIFKDNFWTDYGMINLYGFGFLDSNFSTLINDIQASTNFITESLEKLGMDINPLSENIDCPICTDKIESASVTSCGHIFCYECLQTWLKTAKTCPMCRKDISREKFTKPIQKTNTDTTIIEDCSICFNSINEAAVTSCGHQFCYSCLVEDWLKKSKTCPMCRKDISKEIFSKPGVSSNQSKKDKCLICFNTIVHKFTTHCGHDFCNNCLYSWSFHSNSCPSCKTDFYGWFPLNKK